MSATNGYPFLTKKALASRIQTDREHALEMFRLLLARTSQRTAETRGASGFMASHAGVVRELAATLEERPLDDAEHVKLAKLLGHYTKQLAAHFRTIQLQERPELLQVAAVFSAIPGAPSASSEAADAEDADGEGDVRTEAEDPVETVDGERPVIVDAPVRRRPGRPRGSRNKPKEEQQKRRGRRK